ncbi:MAG: S8 family serine peptidase [Hyphomicrobiaceae bacterium]|nr:S8 family serine peptidase [Hyphomicrobiaceae bacterium]
MRRDAGLLLSDEAEIEAEALAAELTRPAAPRVLDALGGALDALARSLIAQTAEEAPARTDAAPAPAGPAEWTPAALVQHGTAAQEAATAAGGAPAMESSAAAKVKTAGYSSQTNTAQWYIAAMFGGSAAKAQSVLAQFNGRGVAIADYDDGIDKTVVALKANYDASKELVINGRKADPGILSGAGSGVHGTATAGIISADAASNGGTLTGLAYGAKLTAVNIFSGVAASNLTTAIRMMSNFDVTNNSWGWSTKWADSVSTSFGAAFVSGIKYAADSGRGGLGTNIVHAAGNEWSTDRRNVNTSQFGADRHVINVAAVSSNGDVSYYSNRGSALLVGASSGGNTNQYIATTDRTGSAGYAAGDVTTSFNGTSAAAPQVTAIVADMLSANARLGWRDVQRILALTARDVETTSFTKAATGRMAYGWDVNKAVGVNGGGYHYSNDVGFGLADGFAAVRMAEVWSYFNPTPATSANEQRVSASASGRAIATGGTAISFTVGQSISIENVNLTFSISTKNLNNLSVSLTGPSGTKSLMLDTSTGAATGASNFSWTLNSRAFLGELSAGTWTVTFKDAVAADGAKLNSVSLDIYGAAASSQRVFHYTDEAAMMQAYDASRITINDPKGVNDWINLAATTGAANVNLASGASSTLNGRVFARIGSTTKINNVALGDGVSTVVGNNNGNTFVAGHGAATILGGTGNDTFYTGWASDVFTGGAGKDTFAFTHAGFGNDKITDFQKGQDKISLKGLAAGYAQLSILDTGSQITISSAAWAATDAIILTNTKSQRLAASDFVFA